MIRGEQGTVFVKQGDDGDFVKVGDIRKLQLVDDLQQNILDANIALASKAQAFADAIAQLVKFLKPMIEAAELVAGFWAPDLPAPDLPAHHGGVRFRRRRHDGRWRKLDRRQKKPPLWLVEQKLGK